MPSHACSWRSPRYANERPGRACLIEQRSGYVACANTFRSSREDTEMTLGLLVLRVIVGLLFVGHGAQKLFGVWGGHGLEGTGGFFQSLKLHPGRPMAFMAGAAEFGGGALIALGLLTPVGALLVPAPMVTAIA